MSITAAELGRILYEEFERDSWGDIDPYYLKNPPKRDDHPDFDPENDGGEMGGLYEVLERAADRINNL